MATIYSRDQANEIVASFYKSLNRQKLAEGKVWIPQPTTQELHTLSEDGIQDVVLARDLPPSPTVAGTHLRFSPPLDSIQGLNAQALCALLTYLNGYMPHSRKAVSYPSRAYSLQGGPHALTLSVQEEQDWGEGEEIDVFVKGGVYQLGLRQVCDILDSRAVSSFVWGRLIDRAEREGCVILRRFYRE